MPKQRANAAGKQKKPAGKLGKSTNKKGRYSFEIVMIEPVNGTQLTQNFEALGSSDKPLPATVEAKLYDDLNVEQDCQSCNLDTESAWSIPLTAPAAGDYRIDVNFQDAADPPLATANVTVAGTPLTITSPAAGETIDDLMTVTGTFTPGQAVMVQFDGGGGSTGPRPADTNNATGTWAAYFSGLTPCNDGQFTATSGPANVTVSDLTVADVGIIECPVNDEIITGFVAGRRPSRVTRPFTGIINITDCDVWLYLTVKGKHRHGPVKRNVGASGRWTIPVQNVFRGRPPSGWYYFHVVAKHKATGRRYLLGSGRFQVP